MCIYIYIYMYIPVCIVHGHIVSSPFYSNRVLASCYCFSLFWFSPFFILLCFPTLPPDIFFTREDNFPVRLRLLPPCLARSALSSQRQRFPCVPLVGWTKTCSCSPVSAKHLLCFSCCSFRLRCGHVMSYHVRVSAQTGAESCNSRCKSHKAAPHCFGLVVCPCSLYLSCCSGWLVG